MRTHVQPISLAVLAACAALWASSSFAQSSPSYELRWPLKGLVAPGSATAPPEEPGTEGAGGGVAEPPEPDELAAPVSLSLANATLPNAMVGQPYYFDFGSLLAIEGDNPPALSAIYWPPVTGLPEGLSLTDTGVLTGVPTVKNEAGASFEVVAEHEDVEGRQVFTIVVNGVALQVTQISAGASHSCAVTYGGAAVCWGYGAWGQLGNASTENSLVPVSVIGMSSGVTQISAGGNHTCAVQAGAAKCWGYNNMGQLGDNSTTNRTAPVHVSGLSADVAQVSAGGTFTCAVHGGAARCWGEGAGGRIGNGATTNRTTPALVTGLGSGVSQVSASNGGGHACAVHNGAAKCWGFGPEGRLGNGGTADSTTAVDVAGLSSSVSQVVAGWRHTCAIHGGAAKCWGYGVDGRLGNGSVADSLFPVGVTGLDSGVSHISLSWSHACAVQGGALKCWGFGGSGRLGDGYASNRTTPVDVAGLSSDVSFVSAGVLHTCAAHSGRAKCWGNNEVGRLGDGTTSNRPTPTDVSP